jgi:hypothetical protein
VVQRGATHRSGFQSELTVKTVEGRIVQEMAAALIELLSENLGTGGQRDYYGVRVDEITPDGPEFDLTLTFK